MKHFVIPIRESATMAAYIHDKSPELSNADIRPAVLVCPGGGYRICSDREAEPVALAYMAEGYQAFVLRYTVSDDAPANKAFLDGKEALRYLKSHADELQLDAGKIAVAGFSAGGHLAGMLGTVSEEKPAALILGYPVTLAEFEPKAGLVSTADAVTEDTPPTYLFTTSTDELVAVKNTLCFASALDAAGIRFEAHIFPSGPHGLSLARSDTSDGRREMVNPQVAQWFRESCAFLKSVFGELETNNESPGLGMDRRSIGPDTPVSLLLEREDIREALEEVFPGLSAMVQQNPSAGLYSLNVMHRFSPEIVTDEILTGAEAVLSQFA